MHILVRESLGNSGNIICEISWLHWCKYVRSFGWKLVLTVVKRKPCCCIVIINLWAHKNNSTVYTVYSVVEYDQFSKVPMIEIEIPWKWVYYVSIPLDVGLRRLENLGRWVLFHYSNFTPPSWAELSAPPGLCIINTNLCTKY